ncbi:MAG: FUSC family protein [Spirochaetia bacterium]|jgi:hypothetical protein|nr:FUSC family protein [Spirochaetia bacterium]
MQKTNKTAEQNSSSWKKRPSEIRGYQSAYYLTDDKNDYIRIDYNTKVKKIRLYVEIAKEGSCPYFATITEGRVIAEKNMLTKRSFGFSQIFASKAGIISTIPDESMLKLFAGNYGIPAAAVKETKEKRLRETKEKYFAKKEVSAAQSYYSDDKNTGLSVKGLFKDFFETILGAVLSIGVFYFLDNSFIAMGICAAFFGVIMSIFDLFIRGKSNPIKSLFFFVTGIILYIYGYYLI